MIYPYTQALKVHRASLNLYRLISGLRLSPDGEDRLRVRINVEKGKVKDVVVRYESRIKEKWYCIVRYDCSHGFFHRDMLNPKGEEIKQSISINNLKDALTYAE